MTDHAKDTPWGTHADLSQFDNLFDGDVTDMYEESDADHDKAKLPDDLPVLPLRNTVLFPGVVMPITVARDKSIELVKAANDTEHKMLGVLAQKEIEVEDPGPKDLYRTGTIAQILRMVRMPDGSITIVIQGRQRFMVEEFIQEEPFMRITFETLREVKPDDTRAAAMMRVMKEKSGEIIELAPNIPTEAKQTLENVDNLAFLTHFIAANLNMDVDDKQDILETMVLIERAEAVLQHMNREMQLLEVNAEIQSRVKDDLDKQQREYILRQQMRSIQEELGDQNFENEIEELRARGDDKDWPDEVVEVFDKEINKLYRINPGSPEYGVALNYIETLLDLPWREYTEDKLDLKYARKVLDEDHYGLDKVKDRIIEYLAVLKLKKDMKAPILCFYGPPGVGKTSLGKSISRALGREFVRMSLGGVHDEAEIRGHRRTYIGAMPGRVLQGLKKVKSGNPVFVLDEIDKVSRDFRGDPSSALLEVLDPEQNSAFNDHYVELDYDLSPIMFVATANSLETIQPALRDRMEIIEINGYTLEEKLQIAKAHLVPKVLKEHGLKKRQIKFTDAAISQIINEHTRESGVRNLSRKLANVARGVAAKIVSEEYKSVTISEKNVEDYLGARRFESETYQSVDVPGVSVGLAWTPTGGQILFVETALTRSRGELSITGSLGDVMKESGLLAYKWLRAHAEQYNIDESRFTNWSPHIHVPAGAIPKDGPSAGVAILTALASVFTQRKVKDKVGMTGEITLRGKVLPVGGIKEKVLAAKRAGIKELILSHQNEKDVKEIKPEHLLEGLTIHYVEWMHQVLELALEAGVVSDPIEFAPSSAIGFGAESRS